MAGCVQVDDHDSGTASDEETPAVSRGSHDADIVVDMLMLHSLTAAAAAAAAAAGTNMLLSFHFDPLPSERSAKYCDEYVYLSICPFTYLENYGVEHHQIFYLCVHRGRGSVVL